MKRLIGSFFGCVVLAGCGGQSPAPCVYSFSLGVGAPGSTADHTMAAPGNQVTFLASSGAAVVSGTNCAIPEVLADVSGSATWTVSDMVNVQLSPTPANAIAGEVATCLGATSGPVTVTASYTQQGVTKTATAPLTCR